MPEIGKKVPKLKALTGDGSELKLDSLKGKWVVVYFYPKDSTPGCTTEAKDFRDLYPKFVKRNAQVIGVSRDSVKARVMGLAPVSVKSPATSAPKQELPCPRVPTSAEPCARPST